MPLTTRSTGQSPIDSSAVNQYYQALTGGMADQPFTLANTLTVTNTLTGSSNMTVAGTAAVTGALTGSSNVFAQKVTSSQTLTGSSNVDVGNLLQFTSSQSATTVGNVGFINASTSFVVGDGTAVRPINIGIGAAWTPVLTTSSVIGTTVNYATFIQQGQKIHVEFSLTSTSSGSSGSAVAISGFSSTIGSRQHSNTGLSAQGIGLINSGGVFTVLLASFQSATNLQFFKSGDATYYGANAGQAFPSGTSIVCSLDYEVAQ